MDNAVEKKKLSPMFMNLFGVGDFGFMMMATVETSLWMMFLTNAVQFPYATVSFIAGVTAVFDIVWMILSGVIIQALNFKWGKYRSWLIIMPPVAFATTMFMYWPFSGNSTLAMVLIMAGYIVGHLAYNIAYTAHLSMVAVLTDDVSDRAILSSRKIMGMNIGNIVFSIAGISLLGFFGGFTSATAFFSLEAFMLSIMVICYVFVFFLTKPYESDTRKTKEEIEAEKAAGQNKESTGAAIRVTVTNVPFIILLITMIGISAGRFMFMTAMGYYFDAVYHDPSLLSVYLLTMATAGVIGAYFAPMISARIGKKRVFLIGGLIYSAFVTSIYLFFSENLVMFVVLLALGSLFLVFVTGLQFALFADCITYNVWRTGTSGAAFLMALSALPVKVAIVVRGVVMPMLYELLNVTINPDGTTGSDAATVAGIKLVGLLLPQILIAVFVVFFFVFYKLDDKRIAELNADIASGKAPGFARA